MSYLSLKEKLSAMDSKDQIEKFLIFNLSLVLAGIKPAATITISKTNNNLFNSWKQYGRKFINEINLKNIILRDNNNALILFIYDEIILSEKLNKDDTIKFLNKINYPKKFDVDAYVKTLEKRYKAYHCPHELGLFLGIPYKDVKDFMECSQKKCLLCGYWKVYNDFDKAEVLFKKYDMVKEYTISKITNGMMSVDLIKNIKKCINI